MTIQQILFRQDEFWKGQKAEIQAILLDFRNYDTFDPSYEAGLFIQRLREKLARLSMLPSPEEPCSSESPCGSSAE